MDGADVHAKRRRTDTTLAIDAFPNGSEDCETTADGARRGPDSGAPLDDAELDVSLERYEYAAAASIVNGTGGVGFAATCAFNREKSATKELLELLRPHVRWRDVRADGADDATGDGDDAAAATAEEKKRREATIASVPPRLRLNPVKMPGRGFVFVRLSVAQRLGPDSRERRTEGPASATGSASRAKELEPDHDPDSERNEKSVAKALGRAAARAAVALTASVRAGAVPAPRWGEKVVAVQATCAMPGPAPETKTPSDSGRLAETVARVVDCMDEPLVARIAGDAADGARERDPRDVRFAVAFANRFKGRGGDVSAEFKRYAREVVVPAVAAAAETALAAARFPSRRRLLSRPAPKNAKGDERAEHFSASDRADDAEKASVEPIEEEAAVPGTTNDGRSKETRARGASSSSRATVDLRDPDVTFFVEVLSVPAEGADGFVERLAIGAAAKRDGVFELKRGAIRPVALKRANEATR